MHATPSVLSPAQLMRAGGFTWYTSTWTRIGGDFDSLSLAWQYLWFN